MPPGVLAQVAGGVLDRLPELGEEARPALGGVEAGPGELLVEAARVAPVEVAAPAAEGLGQAVDLLGGVAERLGHLAGGGAVAVGDDVGGHRRAVRAVAPVDVLDHLLPRVAGGQVEVDVRPLAPLLGEEALEQEVHLHRVDGGDREGVADRAVGGRAPPLGQDALLLAEAHQVPDDQEVAGQLELLDQRELLLDLRLGLGGQRAEAGAGAVPGEVAQVGVRRLVRRQRVVGEAVAEVLQGEVEALRELGGGLERLRQVGEQGGHLRGRLQVPLPLAGQQACRRRRAVVPWRMQVSTSWSGLPPRWA